MKPRSHSCAGAERSHRPLVPGIAALCLVALGAGPARALEPNLSVHGLLEVTGTVQSDALWANTLDYGDTPFDPFRLRIHVDADAAPGFRVFTQFHADEASGGFRNYGAYASWTPWESRDAQIVAGKAPWFIGTYAPRSTSDKKPLISTPLLYHYQTSLRSDQVPRDNESLLGAAGSGPFGAHYGEEGAQSYGMAVVNESDWDFGGWIVGSSGPLEYAGGITQGTPSTPHSGTDSNSGKTVLGRLGWAPMPAFRIGVSSAWGAYLGREVQGQLPEGHDVNDYHQRLIMADVEYTRSRIELRAEAAANRWETPFTGNLDLQGGYVEGKLGFDFGGYLAGRYEVLRFSDLEDASGESWTWDADVMRYELGAGYRVTRGILCKAVYQWSVQDEERVEEWGSTLPYDGSVVAGQVSIRF
jgi:hypothetical protein